MRWPIEGEAMAGVVSAFVSGVASVVAERPGQAWAIVGIKSRGDVLAGRVAEAVGVFEDRIGALDITLYRDDLTELGAQAVVRSSEVDFAVDEVNVVLVDDVMMTGRSVRAALQSLSDIGRPRRVWMAVLVDRGGRELPIQPDVVGLDLSEGKTPDGEEASGSGRVSVELVELDGRDAITRGAAADG
jgi:pyrimidine operon attenuation protein/uracil phosphoribosyltransferase